MVGDDVESDVGGALRAGMAGILVRTGKFREESVRRRDPADGDHRLDRRPPALLATGVDGLVLCGRLALVRS